MQKRRKARRMARKTSRSGRLLPIVNAEQPTVSVIIPAMNERRTISKVIRSARRVHAETEVIVIANGSTDGTERAARRMGARVISYVEPLGHDVGRGIGVLAAKGRILLFIDADIIISAKELRPYIEAVESGVDIALNSYSGPTRRKYAHNVVLAKHTVNVLMQRPDLGGASLTTVPHAMSRKAVRAIGALHLCVPPKAMAIALLNDLQVRAVHYTEVGKSNPRKRRWRHRDPLEGLIVGDHLEALSFYMEATDSRCSYSDLARKREMVL